MYVNFGFLETLMKKIIVIISLSLIPLMVPAENVNITSTTVTPSTTVSVTDESNGSWRTLITGFGVVSGVIIADLFMGGSLTYSLFGWVPTVTAGPVAYSPEVLSARAAGAVLGEMITPATNLRDVAARRDMFYALMLGIGGTIGAVVTYGLTENAGDIDIDSNRIKTTR
ncbi:membrane hypothetical protein [Gammaproteobacteria bacterium]